MKRHLVCGKDDYNLLVLNKTESNTETIDQEHTDASQVTGVFYKVPTIESTKTNEREYKTSLTYAKKYRPFSIQLYNEILHRSIYTTSTGQTETQVERSRFKLPVSKQYDTENLNWKHEEEAVVKEVIPNKEINDQGITKNGRKANEHLITDEEDNIKDLKRTARKIVIENLEKVIPKGKDIKKDTTEVNIENRHIVKWQNNTQPSLMVQELKQENISKEKLSEDITDISKSVKDTVHVYESIDTELEINKDINDERKLFLLQEIEESIEEGSVKKKSTLFENKKQTTIKGRQLEMTGARKAFYIGSETILRIKRLAESRLSKFLLKIFYMHLTNLLIKLTSYISYKQLNRSRMHEHLKTKLTNYEESIKKRRLSSADIVQLVSGKSKDLTEKMDTVISEFHSKLHINKDGKHHERRAKSVSRVENKTKTYDWLSELDVEEREQIKEELKLATLAAARRMSGRRRSYHNLSDIENRKVDGLTYIAIVESHVYTNKNAIFDDYISRLKTQVNNVLEITDVNEMVATECTEGKYYNFSSNQGYLRDDYMKNTADFKYKESIDEVQGQRIDYVATVTVEHKQKPVVSMENSQKSLTETACTTTIEGSKVKEMTAKAEDRIEANKIENLNEIVIPTPIIEEMELTTSINETTSNQINEIIDVQKACIEITEVKEELPIVNTESTELIKAQARSVEKTGEIKTDLHETKEHEISYAINASTATVKENKVIVEEIVPVVVEVKEDVAKEATEVFDFAEASSLTITELKEQLPTVTIQEELSKTQIFNKECIRQSSDVCNEDIKAIESYNMFEDKGVLNIETEKVIATKELNETYIHEEPIELPKTEIDCDISANSTIEESHYESALSTSCGLLSEITTNIDTAVVTEDVEINKEIAISKIETNEFATAQTVAIATARQTSEVYDEIQNYVEITEVNDELPTIGIVEENYTRPVFFGTGVSRQISTVFNIVDEVIEKEKLEEDKAIEVIEIKELAIAHKVNYANIEEVHITFNELDILSFHAENKEELATSSTEIQELLTIQPICIATALNIYTNLEESDNFELVAIELEQCSSLEVTEEIVRLYSLCYATLKDITTDVEQIEELTIFVDQDVATSNLEQDYHTVKSNCVPLVSNTIINLYEVEHFETPTMIEEEATESIVIGELSKALSFYVEICHDINIPVEKVETIITDVPSNEEAIIKEEDNMLLTVLSVATAFITQVNINLFEANSFDNESVIEEHVLYEEEKRDYYFCPPVCTSLCQYLELNLEECSVLEIDQILEELANIYIEEEVFVKALSICTSITNEINTVYIEAAIIAKEDLPEEKIEISEEENNYSTAVVKCNEIYEIIELLLEDTDELSIDTFEEELAVIQIQSQVFVNALAICTTISSNITTIYFETGILTEEKFQEDNAELFIEENYYITALKACIEISQYVELLLEESNELAIEEFVLELATMSTEPFVLEKSLPLSMSILSDINEETYEANILEIKRIEEEKANILEEVSKLTLILAICIAAIEDIYKDLEECSSFKVDGVKEEIGSYKEEPLLLLRILPICISILEHINTSYHSAEVLDTIQTPEENADSIIVDKHFVTIFCLCTSIAENVAKKLDEVNSFNLDHILEYHATESLEPQIFAKILPKCIATVFTLNIPVFELKLLEDEVFEQMTVSASLETKDYATAKTLCEAIVQDEVLNEVEKTSISYEVKEDNANLSYDDELSSTYAIRAATAKQLDIKYDFAEIYESNLEQGQIINSTTESHHFTTAQLINNATAMNECVHLTLDDKESNSFMKETAVIKIEPKHKNILIHEANVTYDDKANVLLKSRKSNNIEVVSEIKDKNDTINIAEAKIEEKFDNLKSVHIAETNDNKIINERVTKMEEPVNLTAEETKTVRRKKLIKQKASKDIYLESNIQCNIDVEAVSKTIKNATDGRTESIVENLKGTSTSISLHQAEENEANVNVSICKATAKKLHNQETSYNLTLIKPQVTHETVLNTKEETLYVKRKKSLNQYQTEEFEDEFNISLDQDFESGVVIQEISDSNENNDINEGKQSMDASLELRLQSEIQDGSKDVYETSTFVKRRNNDYNSNEESSALTIFKKEDVVNTPVIEHYEEDLSTIVNTLSNDKSEYVASTEISSQSSFESRSTSGVINKKANKRLSKTNEQSHVKMIGNGFKEEIKTSKISATESGFEKSVQTSSKTTEFVSDTVVNKSKSLTLKTDLKREEIELSEDKKSNESSPEIESPSKPPTPLTDEYIFRLIAPLPKSRGNTPAPREPSPDIIDENQYIVNKNLVPTLESVTIERIVYDPPLPTPPTSPVHSTYVKPGLNGGMKRIPRYFKPGLRGGSDRPPIPKEEILEVRKTLSTLTSDINETLKNIEKYKKLVEILKQQKGDGESSKMMEEDENTDKQTKSEEIDKDTKEKETSEQTITEKPIQQPSETEPSKIEPNSETDNIVDNKISNKKSDCININIKEDITNKIEEARIKSYNITEVTSFEEIEKECEDIGIVELAPDTAGIGSIEKEFSIITEDSEAEKPETNVQIKIEVDKEIEKSEDKVDASDEEQKAADEEVAKVTELTADITPTKEISPVDTSPSEADTIKEAHVISLTRVLSSHMLREGLSPDCQKMKDKFENNNNVPEKIEDRSWTTFLQKSTNLQTQKIGHFADLQNKFENQVPFTTKLTDRNELRLSPLIKPRDFNSSPVPWQERVMADNLGASNIKLTPGEEPKFFLAIPTECKDVLKSTVIPLPNNNEEILNIEINKLNEKGKSEHTVVEIIQDAVNFIENLDIGDGRNRMIQLLLEKIKNIADSNIPTEDQLIQMKKQLETLEKVPDIIKETLDNVAEKIHILNKKKEDALQSKEIKYQKELDPKVTITTEISEEKPQITKEEREVEKMSAQTKGQLLVNDKKLLASQMKEQVTNKPQQKFGWMKPEPRPIKLFGGRRWRRPGEEYTEEQIAETILAHSELIHGKTMGYSVIEMH